MKKPSIYKLLFLIGGAASLITYQIKLGATADLLLVFSCLSSGYALMSWVEVKQEKNESRIDRLEVLLNTHQEKLSQADFLEKSIIRLEARVEMLKERQ